MKYKKNQYAEGISIIGLLIAAGFLWWGISGYFAYTPDSWWGLIPIGIGVAIILEQIGAKINRRALRRIVRFEYEDNPEATIREISNKTGLSIKDIQGIRMDLMKQGERLGTNYILNNQIF
ncbi:hypothetical protein LCGC14_0745910 [marine sediment metagenome]|uniref:Uncharacterized protein n=1 Tax=marine sediment metagenome TaxID=412755 RepID=A0A0F9QQA3_9ZZZZ|nr:hypothetical protein [archaeon]HEC38301.1 hypothetical protein [bacterium]